MTVRNYQKGGPSGRKGNSESYTIKRSVKDKDGKKVTRGFTVRCGHGDKRGICEVAKSLVNKANIALKNSAELSDEELEKQAYDKGSLLRSKKYKKQLKRDYAK